MNKQFFVKRKANFTNNNQIEKIRKTLKLAADVQIEIINAYQVYNFAEDHEQYLINNILLDTYSDHLIENLDDYQSTIAIKLHDNQFCARANSVKQCFELVFPESIHVISGTVYCFSQLIDPQFLEDKLINKVDSQVMSLTLEIPSSNDTEWKIIKFPIFNMLQPRDLPLFLQKNNLGMNEQDLQVIQDYCLTYGHTINELELKVIDTYWSDHCRHTTFMTNLNQVEIDDPLVAKSYEHYLQLATTYERTRSLMDIATINARHLRATNKLTKVEISQEVNACSVHVDVDGEQWLIMFKNETHNHPTEIEPFGGAATCVGGAIRDPLSGRSYVYQAIRISGSANPFESDECTLKNKLPQSKIAIDSARGYSSYGNQIGLSTTFVREIFDRSYVAKHLEVGAVMGANKLENVQRLEPVCGDLIILLGGKTGRDGIGGATGSSTAHNEQSISTKSAEVQKGNPIEERKLQRLFKNPQFSKLVKKSNDFGAGGVSVAIGELADSIDVQLHTIPTKYANLGPIELALSESQERMAVVISPENLPTILQLAQSENVAATHVANVTDSGYLRFFFEQQLVLNLKRTLLDSNGSQRIVDAKIIEKDSALPAALSIDEALADLNFKSQITLNKYFDNSIGANTVLNSYGGKFQLTPEQVSVVKIPKPNTNMATAISYSFSPTLANYNPYLSSYYAVIESITKLIAQGCKLSDIHLSFQEYFPTLKSNEQWGDAVSSLLGAFEAQSQLECAAIGGKDSVSGTFEDINVIFTLMSFAFSAVDSQLVMSSTLKNTNSNIYLLPTTINNSLLNVEQLQSNIELLQTLIANGQVLSCRAVDIYGVNPNVMLMALGNKVGLEIINENDQFAIGSFLIQTTSELDLPLVATTNDNDYLTVGQLTYQFDQIITEFTSHENKLYGANYQAPTSTNLDTQQEPFVATSNITTNLNSYPIALTAAQINVLIPIFPGTNSEFDVGNQFADCNVEYLVINNQTQQLLNDSIALFVEKMQSCHILALVGGFSLGDEPDGSGKFIANILRLPNVAKAIENHLAQKHLIIGICNGFQALVKSGLLPGNDLSATLTFNDCNHHLSQLVNTKISSINSPWLSSCQLQDIQTVPISHGEGKFVISDEDLNQLIANGQVFSQYCNIDGDVISDANPNGSVHNIEGIISKDGLIIGKMGHNERIDQTTFVNVDGHKQFSIFRNGINYFKGEK